MDFPAKYKKLWSDWNIRVFILVSLSIQIVLIFLGRLRKTSASMWIRMLVWTSYLLANWVADFVLGQLSNAMDDSSSSNAIIAFWAPFLILHLGGPDTITAYSMEDNELWARHLLSLGYELIIAFYVLFRSLPNIRLLIPTILIFFVAIIKYVERSYSLYKASTESFRRSINSSVRKPSSNISLTISNTEDLNALNRAFGLYSTCKPFFVDATPPVQVYKETIELSKEIIAKEALIVMSFELSYAYDELYTKASIKHSRVGYVLRALCSIFILLAFSLYILAPKDGFDKLDVAITYVLLVASILLDAMATIMLLFSDWMIVTLLNVKKLGNWSKLFAEHIAKIKRACLTSRYWSGELPQLNLINNCVKNLAPNKAPRRNMIDWIKEKLGLVEEIKLYMSWLDDMEITYKLQTQKPIQATEELMNIIATYVHSPLHVSCEKFNEPAGLTILRQVPNTPTWVVPSFVKLIEGLSFNQQILAWHICTDLCFHWKSESLHPLHPHKIEIATEENKPRGGKRKSSEMEVCKYLSDYMMYMVLMRPDMMSTKGGANMFVFWHACYDMVQFIRSCGDDHHLLIPNAKVEEVCKKMMTTPIKGHGYLSPFEIARVLAHLMLVIEEEERWKIVTMAWVELLMQGARNTKAIMHMKQLSRGGELLSFIWLYTKHVLLSEQLDIQDYMNRNVVDTANKLLAMTKIHLQNQC